MSERPILIATRGSALALAQANMVLANCRKNFPALEFELKIIKSTGDRLQSASMSDVGVSLPRGLFTKELEIAVLKNQADMAVHSLKDLPTEMPDGLKLAAVAGKREDVRDVLIYRNNFKPATKIADFPQGLTLATSSTRRKAQILALRPDFKVIDIRGNVPTRLQKLASQTAMDMTILAMAGLSRLHYNMTAGLLEGGEGPADLHITILDLDEMLPAVGQGAIGLQIRQDDKRMEEVCRQLNHEATFQCVTAERALLMGMGGGCQTPIGAYASVEAGGLCLRAVSFLGEKPRRARECAPAAEAVSLGQRVAAKLL